MAELETLMKPKEVADKLRLALPTIYRLAHLGIIPAQKMGKSVRFKHTAIEDYLEKTQLKAYGGPIPSTNE